jgi:Arsenate reductase and related proteins, glutaredoxin family
MAIQIFGTAKNFDVKKAERWFSDRHIPVQSVNLSEKGMSAGELDGVISCLAKSAGSRKAAVEQLIDTGSRQYADIAWLPDEDKEDKLLENPLLMKQPVVRNGKTAATVGFCPEVWSTWSV